MVLKPSVDSKSTARFQAKVKEGTELKAQKQWAIFSSIWRNDESQKSREN